MRGLVEIVQVLGITLGRGIWSFLCYTFLIEMHSQ